MIMHVSEENDTNKNLYFSNAVFPCAMISALSFVSPCVGEMKKTCVNLNLCVALSASIIKKCLCRVLKETVSGAAKLS